MHFTKWTAMVAAMALFGCEDDSSSDGGEGGEAQGLASEACEHMADGPFHDVSGAVDLEGAPDAAFEHARVNVALSAGAGGFVGVVSFPADEAGDFLFYLSADIPMAVTDAAGTAIEIERSASVGECGDVAIAHTVELPVGTAYLWFGPTEASSVGLVAEEAAHEDHEHGEHEHGEHEHD